MTGHGGGVARGTVDLHQVPDQLDDVVGKAVRTEVLGSAQRGCRDRIGAGRPSESEIDAAGMQRLERPELLGDHERRVVGR